MGELPTPSHGGNSEILTFRGFGPSFTPFVVFVVVVVVVGGLYFPIQPFCRAKGGGSGPTLHFVLIWTCKAFDILSLSH